MIYVPCAQASLSGFSYSLKLCPDVTFLPKVVSEFHLHLILFCWLFPPPDSKSGTERLLHTLDVKQALSFYLYRTSFPYRECCLFVSYSPKTLDHKISSQRLSKWLVETIKLCYSLKKVPLPCQILAHSTRAIASSTAFLKVFLFMPFVMPRHGRPPNTFIKHYTVDICARLCGPLG